MNDTKRLLAIIHDIKTLIEANQNNRYCCPKWLADNIRMILKLNEV